MAHIIALYILGIIFLRSQCITGTIHNIACDGRVHTVQDTIEAEDIVNISLSQGSNFCYVHTETYEPDFNFYVHVFFENAMSSVTGALYAGCDNSTTAEQTYGTITSGSSFTMPINYNSTFIQFTGEVTSQDFIVVRFFAGKTDLTTCSNNVPITVQATHSASVLVSPEFPEGARLPSVPGINCTWTINGTEQNKVQAIIALRRMGRCNEYFFLINEQDYCANTFDVVTLEADSFNVVMTGGFKDASRIMMIIYTLIQVTTTEAPTTSSTEAPTTSSTEAPTTSSTDAATTTSTETPTTSSTEVPTTSSMEAPTTEVQVCSRFQNQKTVSFTTEIKIVGNKDAQSDTDVKEALTTLCNKWTSCCATVKSTRDGSLIIVGDLTVVDDHNSKINLIKGLKNLERGTDKLIYRGSEATVEKLSVKDSSGKDLPIGNDESVCDIRQHIYSCPATCKIVNDEPVCGNKEYTNEQKVWIPTVVTVSVFVLLLTIAIAGACHVIRYKKKMKYRSWKRHHSRRPASFSSRYYDYNNKNFSSTNGSTNSIPRWVAMFTEKAEIAAPREQIYTKHFKEK